jgi:hypothetical protein
MSVEYTPQGPRLALVTRAEIHPHAPPAYLCLSESGVPNWTSDPHNATAFESMREAARMALRLPAALRAYGLPRDPEVSLH